MTPAKRTTTSAQRPAPPAPSPEQPETIAGKRKVWKPKSTLEVVLEQIGKEEKRVAEMLKVYEAGKANLNKLYQAKKVLEAE